MNVLYEDHGMLRVAAVVTDGDNSLHIEAPHGKRAKIKAKDVLLRFPEPAAAELLLQAEAIAASVDIDFLWQCCGQAEFEFTALASEYFGRTPSATEAAGILVKLHQAPMYFYREGRGRYRAAPPETLRAALASVERKKQQQLKIVAWTEQLARSELPEEYRPLLVQLLYAPDRNRAETKALDAACAATGLSPARLIERCGGIPDAHEYHLNRFLSEHFPGGTGFPGGLVPEELPDLPLAEVSAFSLDDAATTEIDDAFSLTPLDDGRMRVGIHIAAPALGVAPGSPLDALARGRLSTVYLPGRKITMLPPELIESFTLAEGTVRPVVSLYLDVRSVDLAIEARHTLLERVAITANLRHHALEALDSAFLAGQLRDDIAYCRELHTLWRIAVALERSRGKPPAVYERPDYNFIIDGHGNAARVTIAERRRGAPLDKLVSELMIAANGTWGKMLDDHGVAAIYRVQAGGKVRMSTSAMEHQGLGISHYTWASSPLRRYVDLLNQWQLLALLRGEAPPFSRNADSMLSVVHDFETTYAAYDEFQSRMEHFWCLKWLLQERVEIAGATVVRENLVKFDGMPLYIRVPSLPSLAPGSGVELAVTEIDLIDTTFKCVFRASRNPPTGSV